MQRSTTISSCPAQVDKGALSPSGLLADLSLPLLLESFKPVFDDRSLGADDQAFDHALTIARAFVEAAVTRKAAKLLGRD